VTLRIRLVGLIATGALLVGAPIALGAIPSANARSVAAKAGAKAARQTHARSYKVVSCKAVSSRKSVCKVKLTYSSGARTCILTVNVQYKSRSSSTLVYSFGSTACS
jgi:hypothetical protein